ncbi:MAG: serine/threonine protein kinase [Deltaproteobacteria bacterium]|nr:serine/threonine protein kinase [Deltaproteobacteria bacterium]
MALGPGTMITDKVRLVEPLASGGMGDVWVADHLTLEMRVAAKFIRPELVEQDVDLLERFTREAKAAAQIKSPHVVQIFDHGVTGDGTPYIVMEFLEGNSLAEWIALSEKMSLGEACTVVSQVASVLDKAHGLGIVHRDIKPDNIYLVDDERDLFVKLLDFGIAKLVDEPLSRRVTATGMAVGTPHYMSPEQIMSAKDAAPGADLWALAVVTYEMLTGKVPFDGETLGAVAVAINSGDLTPVSTLLPKGAPGGLDDWFARALCRYPDKRFSSGQAMAEAFRSVIERRAPVVQPRAPAPEPDPPRQAREVDAALATQRSPSKRDRLAMAETEVPMRLAPPRKPSPPQPPPSPSLDLPRRERSAAPQPSGTLGQAPPQRRGSSAQEPRRQHGSYRGPEDAARLELDDRRGRGGRGVTDERARRRPAYSSRDDEAGISRSYRNVVLAALAVVAANLLVPFVEPLGRGHLEDGIGGATTLVLAAVAVGLFVGGAKLWDVGSSLSTWLWLSGGGMLALGAGFAFNAVSMALPGLGLDAYGTTVVTVGTLGAAAIPLGLAIFGLQRGARELSGGHERGFGLVLLVLALVGLGATYHLAHRPIRNLLGRSGSQASRTVPATTVDSSGPGLYVSPSMICARSSAG